nr:hypothetical protein [Kofleriaceae bacterium]
MKRLGLAIATAAACSATPHAQPPPPHLPPPVDAAPAPPPVSAADCDQLVAHALALAAAERGSAATTEDIGAGRVATHRDCAQLTAAQLRCGMSAATLADFEACDGGSAGSGHAQ